MKTLITLLAMTACSTTRTEQSIKDIDQASSDGTDLNEEYADEHNDENEFYEDEHDEFDEEEGVEEYEDNEEEEYNENETDPNAIRILPLGDSITEGVPFTYRYPLYNKLSQEGYSFDFVGSHSNGGGDYPQVGWDRDNEGWAGWTTESIDSEIANWSSQYTVDIALIHLGTNDAGGGDVESSAVAMTSIVQQLRTNNGSISICIAKILPSGSQLPTETGEMGANELNNFVDDWNSRLETLASTMTTSVSPIVVVDMNSDFGDDDLDDGVHPDQSGAEKMAEKWLECISGF